MYAAIIQGVGLLTGVDTSSSESQFPTTESLVRNALIPVGASIVFVAGLIALARLVGRGAALPGPGAAVGALGADLHARSRSEAYVSGAYADAGLA